MAKTLVSFSFGSGPATVVLPMTVYVRPSQAYIAAAGRVIIDAPGPVALNENGEGSALLDAGYVWEFHISVPGKQTTIWKYIPMDAKESVAFTELISVARPPASADDAPTWVLTVHAEYTRVMEIYDAIQETAADLPETLAEVRKIADETRDYRDDAALAVQDVRGRILPGNPSGATLRERLPRIGFPYEEGTAPTDPGVATEWSQLGGKPVIIQQIGAGTFVPVATTDPRLADARDPKPHTHDLDGVVGLRDYLLDSYDATQEQLGDKADLAGARFSEIHVPIATELDNPVTLSQLQESLGTVGGGIPGATSTTRGALKLTGDLGGTADVPRVPGLATRPTFEEVELALTEYQPRIQAGAEGTLLQSNLQPILATALPVPQAATSRMDRLEGGSGPAESGTWAGGSRGLKADALGRTYAVTLTGDVSLVMPKSTSGRSEAVTFLFTQGNLGSRKVTMTGTDGVTIKHAGGTPFVLSTAVGRTDLVTAISSGDGLTWYFTLGGLNFA